MQPLDKQGAALSLLSTECLWHYNNLHDSLRAIAPGPDYKGCESLLRASTECGRTCMKASHNMSDCLTPQLVTLDHGDVLIAWSRGTPLNRRDNLPPDLRADRRVGSNSDNVQQRIFLIRRKIRAVSSHKRISLSSQSVLKGALLTSVRTPEDSDATRRAACPRQSCS